MDSVKRASGIDTYILSFDYIDTHLQMEQTKFWCHIEAYFEACWFYKVTSYQWKYCVRDLWVLFVGRSLKKKIRLTKVCLRPKLGKRRWIYEDMFRLQSTHVLESCQISKYREDYGDT